MIMVWKADLPGHGRSVGEKRGISKAMRML